MNEKTAKKIGEAYAFAQVCDELYQKTPGVLEDLLDTHARDISEKTREQRKKLETVSEEVKEIVLAKAEKTSKKITTMGNLYVGDDWDDPAEVLEWLSFFLGGAIIHWQLIKGSASERENREFETIANEGVQYYTTLFETTRNKAEAIGHARAKQ
ncbi:MAG: hypothetical protein COU08_02150 [Candidatus Harrisonbacteria bacterium CG10_big_fil_rev_8_21_14_0_10_42_17]|uniref:Uncharacterized protein n=1 Tax=Candidatus Harrisonbacteria bacterium CG10_big_fil_rev_8_21_14_0_10_42_17 TaxID=1974584 RepID=A0A2M6WI70_9BACT|nr:MAG: hypothetical protein COU08_02150 [Candidatus Harrisonbacteria bacterium CG10_big_fil_rev_8_21_14_0_10_42_17]